MCVARAIGRLLAPGVGLMLAGCAEHVLWHGHTGDRGQEIQVVESGAIQRVRVGGRELSSHAAVGVDAFAIDGLHVAYPARDGATWRVIVDGVPQPLSWDGIGAVAFAPGTDRLAYAALRGSSWCVVDGGVESPAFQSIQSLAFDAEGHAVFAGTTGGEVRVYVGGRPSRPWTEVRALKSQPSVHYVGVEEAGEHFVDGDRVSDAYPQVLETADEGFIARGDAGREVVVLGRVVARGEVHRLVTGGAHYAYVRRAPTYEVAVLDGREEGGRWAGIDSTTMSGDGEHFGYVGHADDGAAFVMVDGLSRGSWAHARAPVFAKVGSGYAYVGSTGSGAAVVTSRARYTFDVVVEESLVLDDTGDHWAVIAGFDSVRRLYEVVDGKVQAPFDLDEWIGERMRRSPLDAGARLRGWLRADLVRLARR